MSVWWDAVSDRVCCVWGDSVCVCGGLTAVRDNDGDLVTALLFSRFPRGRRPPMLSAVDTRGDTLVQTAIEQPGEQGLEVLRALAEAGADMQGPAATPSLFHAMQQSKWKLTTFLVDCGASVDQCCSGTTRTALVFALHEGSAPALKVARAMVRVARALGTRPCVRRSVCVAPFFFLCITLCFSVWACSMRIAVCRVLVVRGFLDIL